MVKRIKKELGLNTFELSQFLGITPPTLRNWERNKSWPLWALEKCGVIDNKDEQTIQKIKEMLDEY